MYNIRLDKYVPVPQPATSDRIVAAHYYAAWKKGAAGLHNGFDDLHDYPERTPLIGYYDGENPEVCDWEIKWALEHGVNCFIYCWYRKLDNMGKPITENDLRLGYGLHEALFNAKYQQMMKFAIMFEASPRWGGTDKDDMVDHLMPFWMENYFKRGNYLIMDNKPVLFVYQQERLAAECFKDAAEQKATFDACREYAKKCGFDGMIFAVNTYGMDKAGFDDMMARGFDFVFGYNSGYAPQKHNPPEDEIVDGQCASFAERLIIDRRRFVPTASCFSDATPRTTQAWIDKGYHFENMPLWYLSADNFRKVIRRMVNMTESLPDDAWGRRIFMIDNWNEWDEGHYVSPCYEFGYRYLQAIREELTLRDNLPDYRTPYDMGFTGYNTCWEEPDMTEVCRRKFLDK